MRHFALPLFLLLTACLLSACASNTVRLLYSPAEPGTLPASSAKRVSVIMLEDKREKQAIGIRNDSTSFAASSPVADWVSRSVGDALLKQGVQVSYAATTAEAKRAKPDYIVSGSINEVWLTEGSAASVTATIRLSLHMADVNSTNVYAENLSANQERKVLTSGDLENLLSGTLRDITTPAARKMAGLLR